MKQRVLLFHVVNILYDGNLDGGLGLEVSLDILGELDGGHTLAVGASEI